MLQHRSNDWKRSPNRWLGAGRPAAPATRVLRLARTRPAGISELVLEVSDLEAARRFYRDDLGFEETLYGEGREGRYWYLVGDTARLGLWTPQTGLAGGRGGSHVHFAFHVSEEELEGLIARFAERGVADRGPDPARPGPGGLRHGPRRQRRRVLDPGHGRVLRYGAVGRRPGDAEELRVALRPSGRRGRRRRRPSASCRSARNSR